MSHYNVPDDWGMYYNNCSTCGTRYHASEGGCGCHEYFEELEPCECGACDWDVEADDDPRWKRNKHWQNSIYCQQCGKKPGSGSPPSEPTS